MRPSPQQSVPARREAAPPRTAERSIATLSVAHAPPWQLVIAHFLAGAGCAAVAGGLMAFGFASWANPLHPHTAALVHLWAAGWLSLTAIGVLAQFLPVTSATRLLSVPTAWVHFALHLLGLALLVVSFTLGLGGGLTWVGASLLWLGLVSAAINLGGTLLRSPGRLDVWRVGVGLALLHLVLAPSFGWMMAVFFGEGFVAQHRLELLALHMHGALAGWMFGLVIAIGGRLLPMFTAAPEPRRWQVVLALGLLQLAIIARGVAIFAPRWATVSAGLLLAAVWWWAGVMAKVFFARRTRVPATPIATAWIALALIVPVSVAGILAHVRDGLDGWNTYGVLALGTGGLMVNGLLYRIVPFIMRLVQFRRAKGDAIVPPMQRLLQPVPFRAQIACHAGGIVAATASTFMSGATWLEYAARGLLALATAGFLVNVILIVRGWRMDGAFNPRGNR